MLLAGCSGGEHNDLQRYIDEVKARQGGRVPPLPDVKPYDTFSYSAYNLRDPFSAFVNTDQEPQQQVSGPGLRPDFNRKRETLEQFPMDSLSYVGHLEKDGVRWGLVQTGNPDNTVYKVQVGNHVGQNYGEIVAISESVIKIVELVTDGKGGWVEREASMPLNE